MIDIRDARYVSLTSFKRDGQPVHVPVWIAPLADGRAGFTTDAGSFKVKRVRRNPAIELRPCDVRGRVADGAEVATGTAAVEDEGADHDLVHAAVARKYGLQFHLIELGGKIKRFVRKGDPVVAVVITLD
ncbi:MAG TPA: PPOX class F420-dependent oxidoreductase [Acidimicrobiales bacterium]|nr:PPOX class F420-dependent oxidoreductase [Acidimicrobiales bacterium]